MGFEEMLDFLAGQGFDREAALARSGEVHPLPFLWVFGRSHFAVSFFGADVYPENLSVGLEQPAVRDWVMGKFVLEVVDDADRNRHLQVTVELAPGEQGGGLAGHPHRQGPYGGRSGKAVLASVGIVVPELSDEDMVIHYFIHDAVLIVNSPGPISRQGMLQRFRLANAFMRSPLDLFDQEIDSLEHRFVCLPPVQVLVPSST